MKYCTIGVFAHANAGKTTVTENILKYSGVIENIGRVDDGTTITDSLLVERRRGITIKSSYVTFKLNDIVFQLLDTPGHVDFSAEVVRAMSVLDAAIFVISGVEGIESQTAVIWNMLKELNIPTFFFINKLDRVGADYSRVLNEIRNTFSNRIISLQRIASDDDLSITNLPDIDVLEQMADFDDESFEKFLENEISADWINHRICKLYKDNSIYCVMGGSALSELGVDYLLDAIYRYIPYFNSKYDCDFSAEVYMVKRNEGLKEAYVKILSGNLKNRETIMYKGEQQKVKNMYAIDGNRRILIETAEEGQLIIITGIDCVAGDILGDESQIYSINLAVSPMFTAILSAKDEIEKIKLWESVNELNEEDSFLNVRLNKDTNKIQIDLMGRLQGETIVQILAERYSLNATLSEPTIKYKETPLTSAIGKAAYTKTSNVAIKIEPAERGSGVVYHSLLATDYLFAKYQKQVERLIMQYSKFGNYGWELTDIVISLIGGKCDNVGSDPLDYSIAAPIALARAICEAGTKLLEPIVSYTVTTPSDSYSDIVGRLMAMRKGYDEILDNDDNKFIIKGKAFLSEIVSFTDGIRELTAGRGIVTYVHIGYDDAIITSPVDNPISSDTPFNETKFILSMNGSVENLDKGLETKRGKPEKIKRNKHLWK